MTEYMPNDNNDDNPFRVVDGYWQVRFIVPQRVVEYAENAFEDVGVSVSSFEADEDGTIWQVEVLMEDEPSAESVESRLSVMAALANCDIPTFEKAWLSQRDWVSEVQKSFPPISVGNYYIYGSHSADVPPKNSIAIQIDAGQAFGSGEHETTSGCLEAFADLSLRYQFRNLLDMGCGSGILAIAMAKTWKQPVIAADIDPIAVDVTAENIEKNGESKLMRACVSDGYLNPMVKENAPYDLIVANILAKPLVELAQSLVASLAPRGVVILSGLLGRQEDMVVQAHEACGLKLEKVYPRNGWHTLVMVRA